MRLAELVAALAKTVAMGLSLVFGQHSTRPPSQVAAQSSLPETGHWRPTAVGRKVVKAAWLRLTAVRSKRVITRRLVCRLSQARAHGFAHPRPWGQGRMPRLKGLHSWRVSRARTTDKERYL
jgi:hypothetical protein